MGYVVMGVGPDFRTNWLAPDSAGSSTFGPRKNATVFPTQAKAQAAAHKAAYSFGRLGMSFRVSDDRMNYVLKVTDANGRVAWLTGAGVTGLRSPHKPWRLLGPREEAAIYPTEHSARSAIKGIWTIFAGTGTTYAVEPAE